MIWRGKRSIGEVRRRIAELERETGIGHSDQLMEYADEPEPFRPPSNVRWKQDPTNRGAYIRETIPWPPAVMRSSYGGSHPDHLYSRPTSE